MEISLKTNTDKYRLVLQEITNTSARVFVRSDQFNAEIGLSHYENNWMQVFLDQMKMVASSKCANASLEDEAGSYISFTLNQLGHLDIEGVLTETHQFKNELIFGFQTDQTVLNSFVNELDAVLKSLKTS